MGSFVSGILDARALRQSGRRTNQAFQGAAGNVQFRPVNITSGVGTTTFTEQDGDFSADIQLSDQLQTIQNQLFGIGEGSLGEAQVFDVDRQAQEFLRRIRAIQGPERELERARLENRLFQQGRLGSTGGAGQQQALELALARQDQEAALASFGQAQSLLDTLINRGAGAAQSGIGLESGLLTQLALGAEIGGQVTEAGQLATSLRLQGSLGETQARLAGRFTRNQAIGGLINTGIGAAGGGGGGGALGGLFGGGGGFFGGGQGAQFTGTGFEGLLSSGSF